MTFDKRVRRPTQPPVRSQDITIFARSTPTDAQTLVVDGDNVAFQALSAAELGGLVTRLLERVQNSQRATFTIVIDHLGPGSSGRIVITPPVNPIGPRGDDEHVRAAVQRIAEATRSALEMPVLGTYARTE